MFPGGSKGAGPVRPNAGLSVTPSETVNPMMGRTGGALAGRAPPPLPESRLYTRLPEASRLGTIFKVTTNGTLTTHYSFNSEDGSDPVNLVPGSDGDFYGCDGPGPHLHVAL